MSWYLASIVNYMRMGVQLYVIFLLPADLFL